jgi:hypothetical protein
LRLFRLGSVSVPRSDLRADSFSQFEAGSFGSPPRAARFQYELSPADVPDLNLALRVLMPLLPSGYGTPGAKPSFLSTALRWYGEALLAGGPVGGTMASAVACFEALFLGDNPSTELSHRLVQRTIALLRCFGWAPLEMRDHLRKAYDVRSRYVHGANPKKLAPEELSALFRRVAEYARVSCLIWTQVLRTRKQKEVLATLEEALVDDGARVRLQEWCAGVRFAARAP